MEWIYRQPVKIVFGKPAEDAVAAEIQSRGWSRGLLVTSPSFVRRGLAPQLAASLGCAVYSAVTPNPEAEQCNAAAALAREHGAQFVVALGGGSVLDCAKVAASLALHGGTAEGYMADPKTIPADALPLIAVPTTSGTGSEVTSVAVVSDHARGLKMPLVSDAFFPLVAVVDPALTSTVPPYTTACTGFDALCHAVEAYWGRGHQPVCDALAVEAARTILANIEKATFDGADIVAREALSRAATTAGLAFALPKTSSCHACSYPLTKLLGIPHGEACALTLDWFIRFNASRGCPRTQELGRLLGFADADAFADGIAELKKRCGLRTSLADLDLDEAALSRLASESMHPNMLNNPVEVTPADLAELYAELASKH